MYTGFTIFYDNLADITDFLTFTSLLKGRLSMKTNDCMDIRQNLKQAGAELGQAQQHFD